MRPIHLLPLLLSSCLAQTVCAAEFVVHVPPSTPGDARVFVAGSGAALGNWKADGFELRRDDSGIYRGEAALEAGTNIEFKFTLGNWRTVEKNADGTDRANRKEKVEPSTRQIEATVERWASTSNVIESSVVGTLKLHTIDSKTLGRQRTIRVWLPADYEANPTQRYPVLYMHDGQNCFDRATSAFGNEWKIDETLTKLSDDRKVPPMIVVGIDNGGAARTSEYTFVADEKYGGGQGERYANFLLDEVRPVINQTYRTQMGRENTFVGGSSLGGLVSIEIANRHPDVFGGAIVMSPSLWWANHAIIDDLAKDASRLRDTRLWIDMGTREGSAETAASNVDLAREVDSILTKARIEHRLQIAEGAQHDEPAWATRFPDAIEYLFSTK